MKQLGKGIAMLDTNCTNSIRFDWSDSCSRTELVPSSALYTSFSRARAAAGICFSYSTAAAVRLFTPSF